MGKFSLEQKIKDRLKGHEVHIDKGELWKGLGIEEEGKDRKAIWLWWCAGIIGIILVAGLWWHLQDGSEQKTRQQYSTNLEIQEPISKTGGEKPEIKSTVDKLSAIIEEAQNESESNENKVEKIKNTILHSEPSETKTNNENNAQINNAFQNQNSENSIITTTSMDNSNLSVRKNTIDRFENEETTILNQKFNIPFIEIIDANLKYKRLFESLDKKIDPFIKPIAHVSIYEFEVFGGVGNIDRSLSLTRDEVVGYLNVRDTSESLLEHVSLGVSLKRKIGGGFYGKAGVSFNRWNERFSYFEKLDPVLSVQEIPDVILVDLAGNETITYKEGEAISYKSIQWIRYNRLTQIDLPISLGYEKEMNRWSVFGEAAAVLNLSQTFSGYIYDSDLNIIKDPQIYKRRIGVNLGLNAGIGYGITPRLRARLSARYYKSMGSVLETETGIDQEYTSLGMRFGIGYQF